MDVTTADIAREHAAINQAIRQQIPAVIDIEAEIDANTELQLKAVQQEMSVCPTGSLTKFTDKIDYKKLRSTMGDQFYNFEVMQAVGCAVYSSFYGISAETGNVARFVHWKDTISNLHKFGSASVKGIALTGEIREAKDMYVLKVPQSDLAQPDLLHEGFAGMVGINRMRKFYPNGAFLFGLVWGTTPVIDANGKVLSIFGGAGPQVPYVIYESITPSVSFGDYMLTASVDQFHSGYRQILRFVEGAAELIGFTHYDLHMGNVLMRQIKVKGITDRFCIPYTNFKTKQVEYIVSNRVATLIDYGSSTIRYNGKDIGSDDIRLRSYGVKKGPWPLHDAYKLLMFTAWQVLNSNKNKPLLVEMEKIFRFFNTQENFIKCIEEQRQYYFGLPAFPNTQELTIGDLIAHIDNVCDTSKVALKEPGNIPVLECTSCYTFSGALRGAYISHPEAHTFFDFYDMASHLGKSSTNAYDKLVKSFDYTPAKADFISRVDGHLTELNKIQVKGVELRGKDLANKLVMRSLINLYRDLAVLVSKYEDLELWLKVGSSVGILYQDQELLKYIDITRQQLQQRGMYIKKELQAAVTNYALIEAVITKPAWDKFADSYSWYHESASSVLALQERFNRDVIGDASNRAGGNVNELFVEERLPSMLLDRPLSTQAPVTAIVPTPVPRASASKFKKAESLRTGPPLVVDSTIPIIATPIATAHTNKYSVLPDQRRTRLVRSNSGSVQGINLEGRS